jgi:hypothetical protein
MKEKNKEKKPTSGGGGDSIFDGVPDLPESKSVSVSSGPYSEDLPVAGMTYGEIRDKFSDRFDIDPQAAIVVDGKTRNENEVSQAGEALMFIKHAGEKGSSVVIEEEKATANMGQIGTKSMKLADLVQRLSPGLSTGTSILPAGVKAIMSRSNITLWFWEQPPRIHKFRWITADSPCPYGSGTQYRDVRIGLPYLVIMAAFKRENGMPSLVKSDECFFRNEPLKTLEDELCFPGLLNCSKFKQASDGNPLSWICTQHLKSSEGMSSNDPGQRFAAGFEAVRYCLLETAFNLSSEHHEGNSWYNASKKVDKRIETIEAWEKNTVKDPLFALDVPWLKTGFNIKTLAERTFKRLNAADTNVKTADDVARIIING